MSTDIEKYKDATTLEILKRYAADGDNEVTLSKPQQERWQRLLFIDEMLQQCYNGPQIATMVNKRYGITERTAYSDINMCQAIFGGIRKPNAEYVSSVFFDKLMDALRRSKNNLKVEADLLKTFGRFAQDLTSKEQNIPVVPKMIIIVTNPKDVGLEEVNVDRLRREFEKNNKIDFPDATVVE